MTTDLENQLSNLIDKPIVRLQAVAGGDISKAYLIQLQNENLFCKVNLGPDAFNMFQCESAGLNEIFQRRAIKTPEIIGCYKLNQGGCILMEYIAAKNPTASDMAKFGRQLAALHSSEADSFGYITDNFIGSLPQSNCQSNNWAEFYFRERLLPQLQLAFQKKLLSTNDISDLGQIASGIGLYFNTVQPGLLHGDLWNGNFLIATNGEPYLIDPAVYYGHSEVDIAMTQLFGGFGAAFYSAYEEVLPKTEGYYERQDLYQLYYLLVHLNLFGKTYYPQVARILKIYF